MRYVDISDTIQYVARNRSISGIQRVVFSVISGGMLPCIVDWTTGEVYRFTDPVMADYNFLRFFCNQYLIEDLDGYLRAMDRELERVELQNTDQLNICGGFWNFKGSADILNEISRVCTVNVFVHDTLPFSRPDFFEGESFFVPEHQHLEVGGIQLVTATEYTKRSISSYMGDHNIKVIPLPSDFIVVDKKVDRIGGLEEIERRDFVLLIGSLEPRKRISPFLEQWIDTKSYENSDLLVVGAAKGERGLQLSRELSRLNSRITNIIQLNEVSDLFLYRFYKYCSYVVYPSLEEGWGLPISEAAHFGKWTVVPSYSCVSNWHNSIIENPVDFSHESMLSRIKNVGAPPLGSLLTWRDFVNLF